MKIQDAIYAKNWLRFSVDHPIPVILTCILVTIFFGWQLQHLYYKTSIYDMIFEDTSSADQYESFKKEFGTEEIILVVIRAKGIFIQDVFNTIEDLSNRLSNINGVKRVISLPVVKEEMSISKDLSLEDFEKIIKPIGLFQKNLLSPDRKATVISLILDDVTDRSNIINSIEEIISVPIKGISLYQIGMPVVSTALSKYVEHDFQKLPLITIALMIILIFILFQNLRIIIISLGSVVIALVWTLGLMSLTGTALSMMTLIVPIFVIAVGTAYCMYLFPYYHDVLKNHASPKEAVYLAFSRVGVPTSLAVITTTIGLGSLILNRINAVREFAIFSSVGIWCMLIIILLLLPAVLVRFPLSQNQVVFGRLVRYLLDPVLKFIIRLDLHYKKITLPILILITITGIIGIFRINVETNPVSYFKENTAINRNFHDIYKDMAGSFPINVVIDSKTSAYFEDPKNLRHIEKQQRFIDSIQGVDKTISTLDYLRLLKYAKNRYEKEYYTLPEKSYETRMLINDYKSMLGQDMFELFMDKNTSKLNIMLRTHISSSSRFLEIKQQIIDHLEENLPSEFQVSVTGLGIVISDSSRLLVNSQLKSLSIALILVIIIMLMLFLSIKVGFIAIIPNCFPIIVCLGILGWTGIDLSISTSLIMGIVIGLAVDDTIHYLVRYDSEIRKSLDRPKALTDTIMGVGRPIISTTLIIGIGFSVLMFSQFRPTALFGMLMAVTMISAMIADLILLPSLMLYIELVTVWDLLRLKMGKEPQKGITLFRGLSKTQVRYILMVGNTKKFESNDILFKKGEISDSMYVVISGELALMDVLGDEDTGNEDQVRRLITYLKKGDVVGVPGVVRSSRRSATVIAVKATELLQINESMIKRLQLLYPPAAQRFFFNLVSLICNRLENVTHGFSRFAAIDTLTGLYSREFFISFLEKELFRSTHFGSDLAVFIMDMDHFKNVNLANGYKTGDFILKEVGLFVQRHVLTCDLVCRYSGQQFATMLINYKEDEAKELCEHLRERLAEINFEGPNSSIKISVSIGLAIFRPEMETSAEMVIEKAMSALNKARESGMNRVECY